MGRISRTAARRELNAPCVFMHVPKCGGTSVSEALYATVPIHQKIGSLSSRAIRRALALHHEGVDDETTYHDEGPHAEKAARFREQLLLMHLAHGCALVHGHFLFSERAWQRFGSDYRYVSILRDPVDRTLSNYRFARRLGEFEGDFEAFLASDMGRRMAQHSLRFFSGRAMIADEDIPDALARARDNMRRFTIIGFIEDIDDFTSRFRDVFGARLRVGHVNRTSRESLDLTATQRHRLAELCAPDIELSEHARSLA